jgi:hypothetical protein
MTDRDSVSSGAVPEHDHERERHGGGWPDLARIALVTLAAGAVWLRLWEPFPRPRRPSLSCS